MKPNINYGKYNGMKVNVRALPTEYLFSVMRVYSAIEDRDFANKVFEEVKRRRRLAVKKAA